MNRTLVSFFLIFILISSCRSEKTSSPTVVIGTKTSLPTQSLVRPTQTQFPPTATNIPPTLTPTPSVGSTAIGKDGAMLVYVPEGEFIMGNKKILGAEKYSGIPVHKVYLDAYWIDQNEVTNELFLSFVKETGYKTNAEKEGHAWTYDGKNWSDTEKADWMHPLGLYSNIINKEKHPVILVSWIDAFEYCKWAGRRLPTEAEWEKAARGTEARKYPWDNEEPNPDLLNYDLQIKTTTEVGSYPKGVSPYGAYDMAGNVWEWVNDWFDETYYLRSPLENPLGPDIGKYRVVRGGSWNVNGFSVWSVYRGLGGETYFVSDIGFRCAVSSLP